MNWEQWLYKGFSLARSGQYEEAIAAYDKAIELEPDDSEVWYGKGCVLDALGRKKEAKRAFKKAAKLIKR